MHIGEQRKDGWPEMRCKNVLSQKLDSIKGSRVD